MLVAGLLAHYLVELFGKAVTPPMRILLVEDHAESRRNLQRLIERRGYQVIAVASAEEAEVARLASDPKANVVSDKV